MTRSRRMLVLAAVLGAFALPAAPQAAGQGSVPVPDTLMWEKVDRLVYPYLGRDFSGLTFFGDTLIAVYSSVYDLQGWTVNDPLPTGLGSWGERGIAGFSGVYIQTDHEDAIYSLSSGFLYRSIDRGYSFFRVLQGGETLPLVTHAGTLVAWFEAVGYLLCRSTDGVAWTCGEYALDDAGRPISGVFPRHFDRARPGGPLPTARLLANGRGGPAYSDDDGMTWHPSNLMRAGGAGGEALAVIDGGPLHGLAVSSNTVLGGVTRYRIHQSADGITWTDIGPTPSHYQAGYNYPDLRAAPGGWLVAFAFDYVWLSGDGGRSWRLVWDVDGPDVHEDTIYDIKVGPDGRLYAAVTSVQTGGADERGGVYRTVSPVVAAEGSPWVAASRLGVSVRPNPAGASASVVVTSAAPRDAVVTVVDATGREVVRLHDGPLASGESLFALDTSGWAAGVYVVRATVGDQTTTARLVVAR